MDIIRVGISLEDLYYANALAKGLSKVSQNMRFTIHPEEEVDILLKEGEFPAEDQGGSIIYLTREHPAEERTDLLYRYEDCQSMVHHITYRYYLQSGRNYEHRGAHRFHSVVVAGTCGGAGVTSTAVAMGQLFHIMYGLQVLYVSFTILDGGRRYFPPMEQGRFQLSQLLYTMESKPDMPIGKYIQKEPYLDRLKVGFCNTYLCDLAEEQVNHLLEAVGRMGYYDYVLFDIGTNYTVANRLLAARCDTLLLVQPQWWKQEGEEFLFLEEKEKSAEQKRLLIRDFVSGGAMSRGLGIRRCNQAFLDKGSYVHIGLNSEFGEDVAQIAREVVR